MNTVASDHKVRKQLMLIGGEWVPAKSGDTIGVENPGRRQIIATVPRGAAEDVDLAVKKALAAYDSRHRASEAGCFIRLPTRSKPNTKISPAPSPRKPVTRCGRRPDRRSRSPPTSSVISAA